MKCLYCSKEMRSGGVKVIDAMLNMFNSVVWYPEEELEKKIKKIMLILNLKEKDTIVMNV